jgi:prepilin-type N-terminal cleavage/methylation domain-containing protein
MSNRQIPTRSGERGFTLIEAMVAMVILMFGIAAVSNLMVIAGSSNTVANHSTAATAAATRQMELLKTTTFANLVPGGSVITDTPAGVSPFCDAVPAGTYHCNTPTSGANAEFQGVGRMHVRWAVTAIAGSTPPTMFIEVAAESEAPAVGSRSRASFTSFRTLTQ